MTYKRILVPVDGSRTSNLGLREAIRLARGQHAKLSLVHVIDQHYVLMSAPEAGAQIAAVMRGIRQGGRRILARAQALVKRDGLACSGVLLETRTGQVADLILAQAKSAKADLIVIGTHGRRGLSRLVMGSDAEQIVRDSPVPVLLVRAKTR